MGVGPSDAPTFDHNRSPAARLNYAAFDARGSRRRLLVPMTNIPVSSPPVLVLVTWPADKPAETLAHALVEHRLAACVSILPEMQSVYRWEGAVQQDAERQLLIKTTVDRLDALEARLAALHPYEVPEFLVVPIGGGSERYLAWLQQATRG